MKLQLIQWRLLLKLLTYFNKFGGDGADLGSSGVIEATDATAENTANEAVFAATEARGEIEFEVL